MKNMKKVRSMLFMCLVFMAACMLQSQDVHAEEVGKYELPDTRTNVEYDVTGDGKPDTVKIEKTNYDDYGYEGFKIVINGETVLNETKVYYYSLGSVFVQTKGHSYFFISLYGDNDDGPEMIYEYVDKRLVKRANLGEDIGNLFYHYNGVILSVEPNAINLKVAGQTDMLSGTEMSFTYKVGLNGELSFDKEIVNVSYTKQRYSYKTNKDTKSKYLIAAKKIPVYRNTTGSEKSFTIEKGTKLKITKVYMKGKGRYYCITKSGKKGWIKNKYGWFRYLPYAG